MSPGTAVSGVFGFTPPAVVDAPLPAPLVAEPAAEVDGFGAALLLDPLHDETSTTPATKPASTSVRGRLRFPMSPPLS
jgi:hypothetical protein